MKNGRAEKCSQGHGHIYAKDQHYKGRSKEISNKPEEITFVQYTEALEYLSTINIMPRHLNPERVLKIPQEDKRLEDMLNIVRDRKFNKARSFGRNPPPEKLPLINTWHESIDEEQFKLRD